MWTDASRYAPVTNPRAYRLNLDRANGTIKTLVRIGQYARIPD
jgi:hypothetical protein